MTQQSDRARFPESQLTPPSVDFAPPPLFNVVECETFWDRVNRICDQYALSQREHCPA
jgi:hypothetical protein